MSSDCLKSIDPIGLVRALGSEEPTFGDPKVDNPRSWACTPPTRLLKNRRIRVIIR